MFLKMFAVDLPQNCKYYIYIYIYVFLSVDHALMGNDWRGGKYVSESGCNCFNLRIATLSKSQSISAVAAAVMYLIYPDMRDLVNMVMKLTDPCLAFYCLEGSEGRKEKQVLFTKPLMLLVVVDLMEDFTAEDIETHSTAGWARTRPGHLVFWLLFSHLVFF